MDKLNLITWDFQPKEPWIRRSYFSGPVNLPEPTLFSLDLGQPQGTK
jgi:hypothetical protein